MDEKDRAVAQELTDFAMAQFEWYKEHNPAIANVFDKVVANEHFKGELANVFFPICYALQTLRGNDDLPVISKETEERALYDWQSAEVADLVEKEFGYWVSAVPQMMNFFFFFLGTLVKPKEKPVVYEEAKKIFALLLCMVRLERQHRSS